MSNHPFIVAIPARLGSTRLPNKPLQSLAGEPIIAHVVRCAQAAGAAQVVVATDAPAIAEALAGFANIEVCITRPDHASGTDRLAECAQQLRWPDDALVVNLQGDEPFVPASCIHALVQALRQSPVAMATLATAIISSSELFDPHVVKVVCRDDGRALYFSRAPLPWHRDAFTRDRVNLPFACGLRHIGLYAYRAGFLRQFAALAPGQLEQIEALEQLRVLQAGFDIAVAVAPEAFPGGIDTAHDLARAEAYLLAARR